MDNRVNQIAANYTRTIKKYYPIKSAYLYGSHVKGTARDDSDIDIAIVMEPIEDKEYYNIFGELFNIAADFHSNIEPNLLIDDGEDDRFSLLSEVMETGKLIEV